MKNLEQFGIAAFMSAFIGVVFYYLTEDYLYWIFDYEGLIVLSVVVGIIAFILIALYYRKKNKEDENKAEEQRIKKEERKRQKEEKSKTEASNKKKEVMLKTEVAQNKLEKTLKDNSIEKTQEKYEKEQQSNSFEWDYDRNSCTLTISGNGDMPIGWKPWPSGLRVKKVVIMDGVKSVPYGTFWEMDGFNIDFGNTLQSIGDRAFCVIIGSVRFPSTLRHIGNYAFKGVVDGCIVVGENIESIGKEAFSASHCEIRFKSKNPPLVENNELFRGSLGGPCSIKVPMGCYKNYISSPIFSKYVNSISEMNVDEMDITPEDIRIRKIEKKNKELEERQKAQAEKKRIEEERRKKEEEERQKAEAEKKRIEEEKKKKEEEEAKSFDWDYDSNTQTLTITGQGHMPKGWRPWVSLNVTNIIIKDGVLSISPHAFLRQSTAGHGLKVDFGNTLQSIGEAAFAFAFRSKDEIYVFPESLTTIGTNVFTDPIKKVCFKSQNPPSISDNQSLARAKQIEVPMGCLKKYVSSSEQWSSLASRIKEKDVSEMYSSLELEAIAAENKRKAQEKKIAEEEQRRKEEERQKAEDEKKRIEEEKKRKEEEEQKRKEEERKRQDEARRKEEEERKKAEEEAAYAAKYEEELRKKMGL